ncbi:hypothetical protein Hanom_Chr01g00000211 [Helianthus anomalus]
MLNHRLGTCREIYLNLIYVSSQKSRINGLKAHGELGQLLCSLSWTRTHWNTSH